VFCVIGFTFTELNGFIDFYLFEFATFNECGKDFLYSGITPYDSADPNSMTLVRFVSNTWLKIKIKNIMISFRKNFKMLYNHRAF